MSAEQLKKFYLIKEVAELLRVSDAQVYALIDSGRLKCHRFTTKRNGAVRVSQEQLDEYLKVSETR